MLLTFACASIATAQPKPPTTEDFINRMKEQLALTDKQVDSVTAIFKASKIQELSEKMRSGDDDPDARHEIMESMRSEMDKINEQIKGLLTNEQKEKFEQIRQERRKPRSGCEPGDRGPGR